MCLASLIRAILFDFNLSLGRVEDLIIQTYSIYPSFVYTSIADCLDSFEYIITSVLAGKTNRKVQRSQQFQVLFVFRQIQKKTQRQFQCLSRYIPAYL